MNTQNEIWKPIPGYEGQYEVSDQGRVRSLDRTLTTKLGYQRRHKGHMINPRLSRRGYLRVSLTKKKDHYMHRLVLLAFTGPRPEGMECLHDDGNPLNNNLKNLRWGTPSENAYDRVRHGTHSLASRTHCPRGHLLQAPNLRTPGKNEKSRRCLACHRAFSHVRRLGISSAEELQRVSDLKYSKIMHL